MSSLPPPPVLACIRHPGRETGRLCTRCGQPACADCLTQVAVGSHCVDCIKAATPPLGQRLNFWRAGQHVLATKVLMAANVAVFIYLIARDPNSASGSIGAGHRQLGLYRFAVSQGEWWRMITSGFIHFGIIHLAFNMLALWNLGQMLERVVGTPKFVALYFSALLAGSAGVLILERPDAVALTGGASGAVFGLFGATAVLLHRRGINPFRTNLGIMLLINLGLTFTIPGISIGGHIGGLVGGAICGLVLDAHRGRPTPERIQWLVFAAVAAVSLIVGILISR